ncbi:OmpA family protein [uncultured Sulfitobacter sp.]|uniref:OmpA family protein n=1 Tax=uncultured Sulfitobacter sp. TaxID=191468 RepID=UPI0026311B38|nr:OmpA family protein [uncultured Sulfitobacter sp.]
MKKVLHSTTALGVSIALAMPGPIMAQTEVPGCAAPGEEAVFPCVLNGETVESAEGLALLQDALTDEAAAEAQAQAAEEAAAAEQAAAEAQAAEEAAAAEQAAAEAQAAEEAAAAEQAAAEAQAAEEAAAAEQAAAEAQAAEEAAAAEQAAAEAQAAEEAAAAEQAEEAPTEDAEAAPQAEEAPATADATPTDESVTEQAATEQPTAETTEETAAAEAAAAEQAAAEAQAAEDAAAAQKAAEQEAERAERKAARKAERKAARQEERRAERRAARKAEREAIAAAAAEVASGEAQSDVVTEEVTADEVRSSDEEFETTVTGQDAAPATAEAAPQKDDGLSKLEKALLLGLGAVVVGSVLKNGDRVVSNSGDRIVVEDPDGALRVLKDEDALIRRAGDEVRTETFSDGSSRSFVTRPDGSRVVTIRGRDGSVLRRINIDPQGNEYVLFDDLVEEEAVVVSELPPVEMRSAVVGDADEAALRAALQAELNAERDRTFSLRQVREIREVRSLVPELELDAVRFETGSAAIRPEQARALARIGTTLRDLVQEDPSTVILVEGHTDAVGSATYNLALSDRRAETVALALAEYFRVPAENMVTQGYGESALKVITDADEPANRRAVVRNITGLLR